jgi:hypothetical protein
VDTRDHVLLHGRELLPEPAQLPWLEQPQQYGVRSALRVGSDPPAAAFHLRSPTVML